MESNFLVLQLPPFPEFPKRANESMSSDCVLIKPLKLLYSKKLRCKTFTETSVQVIQSDPLKYKLWPFEKAIVELEKLREEFRQREEQHLSELSTKRRPSYFQKYPPIK